MTNRDDAPGGAVERYEGFAGTYDRYRPVPPYDFLSMLVNLARVSRPSLVVDLGSGTGTSTRPWATIADGVIGIEPSEDMRYEAEVASKDEKNVVYRPGWGHETGLESSIADIVTCSSSLHWMEPVSTLQEVLRILRTGGVFAVYGYRPPVLPFWEIAQAYREFRTTLINLESRLRCTPIEKWPWSDAITAMREPGMFRFVQEAQFHTLVSLDAEDYMGWIMTHAAVHYVSSHGISEAEMKLKDLRERVETLMGASKHLCLFGYRAWIGIY